VARDRPPLGSDGVRGVGRQLGDGAWASVWTAGPKAAWSDAELLEKIREVIDASAFHGEGYRKVWAGLHFAKTRASKARVLRLMPEAGTRP
jgi:hypothetical protein